MTFSHQTHAYIQISHQASSSCLSARPILILLHYLFTVPYSIQSFLILFTMSRHIFSLDCTSAHPSHASLCFDYNPAPLIWYLDDVLETCLSVCLNFVMQSFADGSSLIYRVWWAEQKKKKNRCWLCREADYRIKAMDRSANDPYQFKPSLFVGSISVLCKFVEVFLNLYQRGVR